MNLVDSFLANAETTTSAITIICELLILMFCNRSLFVFKNQLEINTLKEVLLHTLYKLDCNVEVLFNKLYLSSFETLIV